MLVALKGAFLQRPFQLSDKFISPGSDYLYLESQMHSESSPAIAISDGLIVMRPPTHVEHHGPMIAVEGNVENQVMKALKLSPVIYHPERVGFDIGSHAPVTGKPVTKIGL